MDLGANLCLYWLTGCAGESVSSVRSVLDGVGTIWPRKFFAGEGVAPFCCQQAHFFLRAEIMLPLRSGNPLSFVSANS